MSARAGALVAGGGRQPRGQGVTSTDPVMRRVALVHVGAGTIGAVDLFLLLFLVLPSPPIPAGEETAILTANLIAVVIGVPLASVIGTVWGYRVARPARRFIEEGRAPSDEERRATLRHPLRGAGIDATLWFIAALILLVLNLQFSSALAVHIAATVVMGGLTTTAVTYLMTERLFRPLTAQALAGGSPPPAACGPGVQGRLVLAWVLATGVSLLGIVLVACDVLGRGGVSAREIALSVLILALAGGLVGLAATVLVARSLSEPLRELRTALGRIAEGELDTAVPVDDGSEIGMLQAGFNRMAAGLRERERLRDLFGRHVGEEVARSAVAGPVSLGGERREVAVVFVDLVGSTTLATQCPPEDVVTLLNRFFALVVDTVGDHGGWVNKFEGDAALCVFGAPVADEACAASALRAARVLHRRLAHELPETQAGIGVSAGPAVAGNVGAVHRFEYTVIGDPVNEAARLCELAKRRPEGVLASEAVLRRSDPSEHGHWELGEAVVLRGRTEPTRLALPAIGRAATPRSEDAREQPAASEA